MTVLRCQRECGTAYALNMMIEAENLTLLSSTAPTQHPIPSASGEGQIMFRCPMCLVVVWSQYGGKSSPVRSIRVGTLDRSRDVKPGVHIYVSTKMEWIDLSKAECKVFEEYYKSEDAWGSDSLARKQEMAQKMKHSL